MNNSPTPQNTNTGNKPNFCPNCGQKLVKQTSAQTAVKIIK